MPATSAAFRVNAALRIETAVLLAGVDYDDFRRDASRSGTAKKYWAGATYDFNKTFGAVVRIEDNINFHSDNLYQGFAALQINL